MSLDIRPVLDKPALTKQQIAHAQRILAQWKVVRAAEVTYDPEYRWIVAVDPAIELEFAEVAFTDDGEQAHNLKQLDNFTFKLKKWPPPHKREPVQKTRPQNEGMKARLRQKRV